MIDWKPASEPPEEARSVVVWIGSHDWRGEWKEGFFYKGRWYVEGYTDPAVTHWGDVTPPEKGND